LSCAAERGIGFGRQTVLLSAIADDVFVVVGKMLRRSFGEYTFCQITLAMKFAAPNTCSINSPR
jgi:hypothetical protein